MITLTLQCSSCRQSPPTFTTIPLCTDCAASPLPCPPLCPNCASPQCPPQACLRPWIEKTDVATYNARYLLLGPGYRTIRRWKIVGGRLFDQRILKMDAHLRNKLRETEVSAVIPIPQRLRRAWNFRGSPADRVAQWISREIAIPFQPALAPSAKSHHAPRQAELKLNERFQNPIRFEFQKEYRPYLKKGVILVDDFMTTGHTLRAAARLLNAHGISPVHVFCLGVRPSRTG